jgi:uncharacterized protein (DUF2141 family)
MSHPARLRPLACPPAFALLPVLATALMLAAAPGQAQAAELELELSGFAGQPGQQGQLLVAVYADPAQWLKKAVAARRVAVAPDADGKLLLRLTELPEGPLAVSVFQDLNGNGRLDANPMGMPLEPFAFSRQAQGMFGPPSFDQARLEPGTARHAIRLPAQP